MESPRHKNEGAYSSGEGGEESVGDPGSKLRLVRAKEKIKRAKKIEGVSKKNTKNVLHFFVQEVSPFRHLGRGAGPIP